MVILLFAAVLVGAVASAIGVHRWAKRRREALSDDRIRAIADSVRAANKEGRR
ncbi:MAG: hypothetical protein U0637_15390 [Phycisphaerales bacterium]